MQTCSKKVFAAVFSEDERANREIDSNIISLTFNDVLEKQLTQTLTPPAFCPNCQAILSSYSSLYELDEYKAFVSQSSKEEEKQKNFKEEALPFEKLLPGQRVWICEFCSKHSVLLGKDVIKPQGNDIFYGKETAVNENEEEKVDFALKGQDSSIIFCIDNSGSMAGTNLRCVKHAVQSQLTSIHAKYPKKKVGLVTFDSIVRLYGDCHEKPLILPEENYNDYDKCLSFSSNISEKLFNLPISESLPLLQTTLKDIEVGGSTALGPGLLASIGLILKSKTTGSLIVICTDGMSNCGIGSMNLSNCGEFYNKVGKYAKEIGVMISVLTIKGGQCSVDKLAILSDFTGGMVSRIKPKHIAKDFGKALTGELIGTEAKLRLQLHPALAFRNENQNFIVKGLDIEQRNSILKKDLGNVTLSTEETFEFRFKSKAELMVLGIRVENLNRVSLQAQIQFQSIEGKEVLRVLTIELEVSKLLEEVNKNSNVKIVAMRAAHDVAREAEAGNLVLAKQKFDKWEEFLEDKLNPLNKDDEEFQNFYNIVKTKNQVLEKQLNKGLARKFKKNDKKVQKDLDEMGLNEKKEFLMDFANNSSSGSSDDCQANLKKFARKRQASFNNLSECDSFSDEEVVEKNKNLKGRKLSGCLKKISLKSSDSDSDSLQKPLSIISINSNNSIKVKKSAKKSIKVLRKSSFNSNDSL